MSDRRREISVAVQTDKDPSAYAAIARAAEELGFDTLSMYADLLYQPPILPLAVAAMATSRIKLGPAALNPFVLHPVEIAGQIATLDAVSNGRAYLGLVRGAWLDEIGVDQDRPISRMREAIDVVERLLAGEVGPYEGEHFRLDAHHRLRYDVVRPRVPLLIGSWGPKLLALGGGRADEVKIGGSSNPDMVGVAARFLAAGAKRAGRDPDDVGICMGAVTFVDEDRDVARAAVRRELAHYLPVVAPLDPTIGIEPDLLSRMSLLLGRDDLTGAGSLIPDDLVDRFAFAGSPADIISRCEAVFDAGATRIEFGTPHGSTTERGLELLGGRVLPALTRRSIASRDEAMTQADEFPILRIDGRMPLDAQRRAAERLVELATEPADVVYRPQDANGVPCLWAVPSDPAPGVVQYLHGGYAMCSLESHRRLAGHVARASGVRVLLVGYRLAPEHRFPAAIDDSVRVYGWLLDIDDRVALAGESAGGGITIATLLALRDAGDPLPRAAAVMSPWVDMTVSGASMVTNADSDLFVGAEGLRALARHVLGETDATHPLASPIFADLSGLPPLLVQVAGNEVLLDDAGRLAEAARAAGVDVAYECIGGMQHAFQLAAGNLAEADTALERLGAFLRSKL